MRRLIFVLFMAFAAANCSEQCDFCGGTQESKDKPYSGKAEAPAPYHTMGDKLEILPGDCDNMGCTYFITVTVWLHNPTSQQITTDVTCKLKYDEGSTTVDNGDTTVTTEYEEGKNTRNNVTVKPKSSKEVQIKFNITAQTTTDLVAECETYL